MTVRAMTESERSILAAELARARRSRSERLRVLPGPALMLLAALAGIWALLAWLAARILSVNIGWKSPFAPWILAAEALIFVWLIGLEVVKIFRTGSAVDDLSKDLHAGVVEEQELALIESQRFQEPEHGGYLYFLLVNDGRVYVQFDVESQDLGVDGKDPATSRYAPHSVLKIVRAPISAHLLASVFSGDPLQVSDTRVLAAKPAKWPESDTFSRIPWSDLVSTYAA